MSSKKNMILVVDDDPEVAETFRFALSRSDFGVAVADNGNQAIALIESCPPDLVVLDLMLPKRSGFLVLESIRQHSAIPVIVVTANEGKRHREYVELLGVSQYFCKPVSIEDLVRSVKDHLKPSVV